MNGVDLRNYALLLSMFRERLRNAAFALHGDLPAPHIPGCGSQYSSSVPRIAFVGIDTAGWHSLAEFATGALSEAALLNATCSALENLEYVEWYRGGRSSFWSFVLEILAQLCGLQTKDLLQHPFEHSCLRSFSWANAEPIEKVRTVENYAPGAVSPKIWEEIRQMGSELASFDLFLSTFNPRIVIILSWALGEQYLGTSNFEKFRITDDFFHYKLEDRNVDVLWTRHPTSMRRIGAGIPLYTRLAVERINQLKL